jgi:hypothetical protein
MHELFLSNRERSLLYALPAVTRTLIVCGDCSAPPIHWRRETAGQVIDERRSGHWPDRPFKTLLTLDGRCDKCGSRNYELASVIDARHGVALRSRLQGLAEASELEQLYQKETFQL